MSEDAPLTPPMHEIAQTLVFSNDIPCDTTIADAKDGRQLYVVETKRISTSPKAPVTITTDVFDIDADKKNLVASLEWRDLVSDIVTIPSRDMRGVPLSTWLKKSVIPFRNTASFKDHSDRTYKWDTKGLRAQLRLVLNDEVIAYFERAQLYGTSTNPSPTPSMLHLHRKAEEVLEDVVLSFLFMEKSRRRDADHVEKFADVQARIGTSSF